jgi:hypothetical protein
MSQTADPAPQSSFPWRSMVIWTLVLVTAASLLTRHSTHVLQFLPFAFLLACPLMHLFHHRRHRH